MSCRTWSEEDESDLGESCQPSATRRRTVRWHLSRRLIVVLTFDPFREFDRLADRMLGVPAVAGNPAAVAMPMDLYRSGDHFVLHCDLAGIDPGSVDINVDGRVLTIRAERSARTDA